MRLAEKIGEKLFPGAVILLTGDLGAGKNGFCARYSARALKTHGLVNSPSYTIMNIYDGALPLVHFDLYRITDTDEFYAIGADEYLGGDNVCAIEWPEHAENALGEEYLEAVIKDMGGDTREITLRPKGKSTRKWLISIKDDING